MKKVVIVAGLVLFALALHGHDRAGAGPDGEDGSVAGGLFVPDASDAWRPDSPAGPGDGRFDRGDTGTAHENEDLQRLPSENGSDAYGSEAAKDSGVSPRDRTAAAGSGITPVIFSPWAIGVLVAGGPAVVLIGWWMIRRHRRERSQFARRAVRVEQTYRRQTAPSPRATVTFGVVRRPPSAGHPADDPLKRAVEEKDTEEKSERRRAA